jgi:hypothetical protein
MARARDFLERFRPSGPPGAAARPVGATAGASCRNGGRGGAGPRGRAPRRRPTTAEEQDRAQVGLANVAHDPPSLYPSRRSTGSIATRRTTYVLGLAFGTTIALRHRLSCEQSPQELA